MLNIMENQWATVWNVEDKGNYVVARLSTARKDKQNNSWINSSWFARFVGNAVFKAKYLKDKDRIQLTNAAIENVYDKEKKRSYLNLIVFDFDGFEQKQSVENSFTEIDDEELPF